MITYHADSYYRRRIDIRLRQVTILVIALFVVISFGVLVAPLPTAISAAGATSTFIPQPTPAYVNYAEALQKSIYYYDASKSGSDVTTDAFHLDWRGNTDAPDSQVPITAANNETNMSNAFIAANLSILDPTGKGYLDLHGGFHDAGDHVKFGLPQAYAASTLGWGYWEFKPAFVSTGQDAHMLDELKWFTDYFMRSTFLDSSGNVVAFAYQVGDGGLDHPYWGPAELQYNPNSGNSMLRPAWLSTSEHPALDMVAEASAALSLMSINYASVDPVYAAKALTDAKALYAFGRKYMPAITPGKQLDDSTLVGYSGGFYGSSGWADDMSWAAVWLYTATANTQYIKDIVSVDTSNPPNYTGYLARLMNNETSTWQNIWVHSWDAVWGGVFLRLNQIYNYDPNNTFCTADPTDCNTFMKTQMNFFARWNLEYWAGVTHNDPNNSNDTNFLAANPSGYKVVNTWGSNRYNTAAQTEALVYYKDTGDKRFADWAQTQMNYIMGGNIIHATSATNTTPTNVSEGFIVGYGPNFFNHPHHGAAHGSFTNSATDPMNPRHMLWGALLGGPDTTDTYDDATGDFVFSETTVDYQSTLVTALAGYELYYPTTTNSVVANFPPTETPYPAYNMSAEIEQENNQASQVTIQLNNQSATPPHFQTGLSARYYFDISELVAAGQNISAVSFSMNYDQAGTSDKAPTTVVGPVSAGGTIYYYEFDWTDQYLHGARNIEFTLTAAGDAQSKTHWDATNDPSNVGVPLCAKQGSCLTPVNNIPVYLNGVLVYGQEPKIATATPTVTPGGPTVTSSPVPPAALQVAINAAGADNNQQSQFGYQITNTGTTAASSIALHIDFTIDGSNPASSYVLDKNYDQSGAATFSGPTLLSGNIYYFTINFGTTALPAGNSWTGQVALHLASYASTFNSSNDWFHTGYAVGALPASYASTTYLPAYVGSKLVWGSEPGGTPAASLTPTFAVSNTPTRTNTPAATATATSTLARSNTPTNTPTRTNTPVATATSTSTPARSNTPTSTLARSNTPTNTPTRTNTPIPTTPAPDNTPTRTNTPITPTTGPTNTPVSGTLTVQIKGAGTDNNQETAFDYQVNNTGTSAVANITVRIYFTLDGSNASSNYTLEKYYDQSGVATVSGPTLASGSIYYYTVSYGTTALAAGSHWEFQTALHLSNWGSTFDGSNDYFHTGYAVGALPASYTNTNYISAYVSGTLTWGTHP